MHDPHIAATQFVRQGHILAIEPYGEGNLNDTFLVLMQGGERAHFVLQRINTHVFAKPELIMLNLRVFSDHLRQKQGKTQDTRKWVVPYVISAQDGRDYYIDDAGGFWRAQTFVANAVCYQTIQGIDHAREAGYALGRFHALISDLDPTRLHDTLEGFHIAPRYLDHFDRVLERRDAAHTSSRVAYGLDFVEARRDWASVLEDAKARGDLVTRPIHGDPKINNFMIDKHTGQAISLVDLDTVKPGLVHYDIGDCLRSCCNPLGEETDRLDEVFFDTALCRAILEGYLDQASQFLSDQDRAYLYDAIRLIAFELGLRFFTDHLEGNVYFKARHPEHNLMRALVQFKLTESIEAQADDIRTIIHQL
jgi:Ser/Thr protein kinase RdoA (MazF antagonist)